ncbi:uncharacterized protein BDV17DRAFT_5090 [Aspergillus undulatus]|uniref:uncharacterized protein n=1 Tax=Aspergillus undulatus TaxID=1810928 RepID=UPI003CCDDD69
MVTRGVKELFGKARFALKPLPLSLAGDETSGACAVCRTSHSLKIEFHLLPTRSYGMVETRTKPDFGDDLQSSLHGYGLFYRASGEMIRSGHVVEFTTTNCREMPLPSWDLLERMQWMMNRVAAFSEIVDAACED